ncbi:MAG: 16S rRNA (adenine(1518)-N(6)/adenine(1519)-N(6))-dimethyltransferase RsmA [Actinomycetota bacterium]
MVELLGAGEIRKLCHELEIRPTKKLGQNFVIDPNTIRRIVSAAKLEPSDRVVEIGPGLGSLTLGLMEAVDEITAVEFDPKLARQLPNTILTRSNGRSISLIEADAMKVTDLGVNPDALVANLPYNISVPVLLHFLSQFPSLKKGLVLVQSEVADRLIAKPGSKIYGSPSVKLAWYAKASSAGTVGRSIFWPVPNVDSSLVYFEKRKEPFPLELRSAVFEVVDAAFAQRRKTLRQALAGWAGSAVEAEKALVAAGISPQARGEDLMVEDFLRLVSK